MPLFNILIKNYFLFLVFIAVPKPASADSEVNAINNPLKSPVCGDPWSLWLLLLLEPAVAVGVGVDVGVGVGVGVGGENGITSTSERI